MNFPTDIELIIYRYLHQLKVNDLKREILQNNKLSFIYTLKWRGNCTLEDFYKDIDSINRNISCLYMRNKLLSKVQEKI